MIFADEPTGALDTRTGKDILSLLREAVDGLDQTVVMVTHDPIAAAYADTVVFLADGQIVDDDGRPLIRARRRADDAPGGLRDMLRIAFSTLAARKSGTLGAFAAVSLAVVLVVSCGILLESSLRAPTRVERLAAAAVVVQGDPTIRPTNGEANVTVLLSERRRLSEALAARVPRLAGNRRVVADRSVYAQVVDRSGHLLKGSDGSASVGHGWDSAALTPYTLTERPCSALGRRKSLSTARLAAGGSFHPVTAFGS